MPWTLILTITSTHKWLHLVEQSQIHMALAPALLIVQIKITISMEYFKEPIIYLTSLMADLCQDIRKRVPIIEHFLEGIILLRYWYIDPNEKTEEQQILTFFFEFPYHILNWVLSSRKIFIKAPVKYRYITMSKRISAFNNVNDWVQRLPDLYYMWKNNEY